MSARRRFARHGRPSPPPTPTVDLDALRDACNEVSAFAVTLVGSGKAGTYEVVRALLTVGIRQCFTKGMSDDGIADLVATAFCDARDDRNFTNIGQVAPGSGGDG